MVELLDVGAISVGLEQVPTERALWHIEQLLCPMGCIDHDTCSMFQKAFCNRKNMC